MKVCKKGHEWGPPDKQCPTCWEDWRQSYYQRNRNEIIAKAANWYVENKDRRRASNRKRLYGMSKEEYDTLLLKQDNKCAICRTVEHLHVDHCHDTQQIRGLLCGKCNTALGLANEDPTRLEAMASYIREKRNG